tara:strand:- start:2365 stop:2730 length:366 start_codon:yes stop_codon:yes gene_type:complete
MGEEIENEFWSIPNRPLCRTAIALKKDAAEIIINKTSKMKDTPGDRMIANLISRNMFKSYSTKKMMFSQNREKFGSHLGNSFSHRPIIPKKCADQTLYSLFNIGQSIRKTHIINILNRFNF